MVRIRRDRISKMTYSPVNSGDVPTAPTVLDRSAMIDALEESSGDKRCAVWRWIYRRDNQSLGRPVTIQAFRKPTLETRHWSFLRIHRVEDEALGRVERR